LLKPLATEDAGKKCLVLDLDETLLHSSFKVCLPISLSLSLFSQRKTSHSLLSLPFHRVLHPVADADFVIPVEIEGQLHSVYVLKRPGVDEFLRIMGERFEIVVFTASLAKVP